MNVSFNCATFNVGTAQDFAALISKLNSDLSVIDSYNLYEENLKNKFVDLIESFDVICLQELGMDCRHQVIYDIFKRMNFTVVGNERLSIAFKADRFEKMADGPTFRYDPDHLTWWQYELTSVTEQVHKLRPSYYVDLKEPVSGAFIRVVSAHFKGFDVKKQKEMTQLARTSPEDYQRLQFKVQKMFATRQGDLEVDATLFSLDELTDEEPDLTILGVDANSTTKNVSIQQHRVHPKRLRKLEEAGFVNDTKDRAPTLYDKADGQWRKYDYLFARFATWTSEGEISSYTHFPLRETNYSEFISDHVPVKGFISFDLE